MMPGFTEPIFTTGTPDSCQSWLLKENPLRKPMHAPSVVALQPQGIGPSSESSNSLGKRAAVAEARPAGWGACGLAGAGAKTTKQPRKRARAIASHVSFICPGD